MFASTIFLVTLAAAAFGGPLHTTGGRIIGGTSVAEGEIPWQVSIQTVGGSPHCGGSIISADWVLTAAHCSDINPINFRVRSGALIYYTGGAVHNISQLVPHPQFNVTTFQNDIAVWKVDPPFVFDASTGPVNLPPQGTPILADTVVWVSGWGRTTPGGEVSTSLLKVDVPIVDTAVCAQQYATWGLPPDQICAGLPEGGKDRCQEDSGGPLFLAETSTQFGVASWGNGCARPRYPGVYTEVAAYRDWISQQTGV